MHVISKSDLQEFHRLLHTWYARHGRRDLPWRNTDDAYAIYLSEVMLQQTQVKTVLERFYHPFLGAFPTLQALADAPQAAVMKQWEGLGYYSRAANLHKAAQAAAPNLPDNVDRLMALPGIGRNTAHAVAAFAFRQPVAVMEANVKRVLCRIFALQAPKPDELWNGAQILLDAKEPFDYNQAMMDIGAMVCTKRQPACAECPAKNICKGKANPQAYPAAKEKKATPIRKARIILWHDSKGRLQLNKRETAFLGGLYGFAEYPVTAETFSLHNIAYPLTQAVKLGDVTQVYSHFRMEAEVWTIAAKAKADDEGWYDARQIADLALSGIDHKILNLWLRQPLSHNA